MADTSHHPVTDDAVSEITLVDPVVPGRQASSTSVREPRDSVKLKTKKWWSRHIYLKSGPQKAGDVYFVSGFMLGMRGIPCTWKGDV